MKKRMRIVGLIAALVIAAAVRAGASVELARSFSTGLFNGTKEKPMEIITFKFKNTGSAALKDVKVDVSGDLMLKSRTETLKSIAPDDFGYVRATIPALPEGGTGKAKFHIKLAAGADTYTWDPVVVRTAPDWKRIHLHTHFHYDTVWINKDGQRGYALTALDLIRQYINTCRTDPTYTFVIEQIPYMKPYWDNYPEQREALRSLMEKKQLELVGGAYDQPDESSVYGEMFIRNFYYGRFYEENVMKGRARHAWQIDNFGHAIQFPQILRKSGMDSFTFLRGGPEGLPRQFIWTSPDGSSIYTADLGIKDELAKAIKGQKTPDKKEDISMDLIKQYEMELLPNVILGLQEAHSTHQFFLPIGDDFMPPQPLLGTLTRYWKSRYLYPSLKFSLPSAYFDEVFDEIKKDPLSQRYTTKDLNPVFTGCYSSRTDLKIANRLAEMTYLDAETTATVAWLLGAEYPARALDKSLRELLYNDHHDSIPGTTNELSYLDILYGWRESLALSWEVKGRAMEYIASKTNTASSAGFPLFVMNTTSRNRSDIVEAPVNFSVQSVTTMDGKPASFDVRKSDKVYYLRLSAADVPSVGYKIYYAKPGGDMKETISKLASGTQIENEFYKVTVDPARGGGIVSLIDKKSGVDFASKAGGKLMNTLYVYDDKGDMWGLKLSGGYSTTSAPAKVSVVKGQTYSELVVVSDQQGFSLEQKIILSKGVPRVDFATRVYNYKGENKLFKLVFPVSRIEGLTPVYGERFAAIARKRGEEFPVDGWAGWSSAVSVRVPKGESPLGVAAVVVGKKDLAGKKFVKPLIEALGKAGNPSVTFFDTEMPDTTTDSAIYVGAPASFPVLKSKLGKNYEAARKAVEKQGIAVVFPGDRPVVLISKKLYADDKASKKLFAAILKDGAITIPAGGAVNKPPFVKSSGLTAALINKGSNGYRFDKNGTIEVQLLRSATGRPGGEAFERAFSKEDWNHEFKYSFVAGKGDWKQLGVETAAQDFNRPLDAVWAETHGGTLPGDEAGFFNVEPKDVIVSALKKQDDSIPNFERTKEQTGTVIRMYNMQTADKKVKISSRFAIGGAEKTDMQERNGKSIGVSGGSIADGVGAWSIETYKLDIAPAEPDKTQIGLDKELYQPVSAAYWKENDNVAPIGYQPVTVSFDPSKEEKSVYAREVKLKIASDYTDQKAGGSVTFELPEGWKTEPERVEYSLEPGGFEIVPVKIFPKTGDVGGIVRAVYENEGQKFYAAFAMGEAPLPRITVPDTIVLKPGEIAAKPISILNDLNQPYTCKVAVVSPIGTWRESPENLQVLIDTFIKPLDIPRKASMDMYLKIRASENALPGSYWFVVKVMANGEYTYSKPVEIKIEK